MYMLRLRTPTRARRYGAKLFVILTIGALFALFLVACDQTPIKYKAGDCVEVDTDRGHGVCRVVDGFERFDFYKTRLRLDCRFDVNNFHKVIWEYQAYVKPSCRCEQAKSCPVRER